MAKRLCEPCTSSSTRSPFSYSLYYHIIQTYHKVIYCIYQNRIIAVVSEETIVVSYIMTELYQRHFYFGFISSVNIGVR